MGHDVDQYDIGRGRWNAAIAPALAAPSAFGLVLEAFNGCVR
jgi:hypothetical protein